MSVSPAARRSMRIIALPLTTATRKPNGTPSHLTYYHFVTPPPKTETKPNWATWATSKASDIWAGFGKAPEGHWKRRTFLYGERLVDRIDFEELALKSIDTSLAPRIFRQSEAQSSKEPVTPTIPLIYPGAICSSPLANFRALLEKRTPRHRKGAIMWLLIAPLTAPFMIVPVIPNLPFFFCVWRSWSHWRAYKASAYLEEFVQRNAIVPEESSALDKLYVEYATPIDSSSTEAIKPLSDVDSDASSTPTTPTSSPVSKSEKCDPDSTKNTESPRRLLLTREAVPELVKLFQLRPDSSFAADVYRALEQARLRMEKDR